MSGKISFKINLLPNATGQTPPANKGESKEKIKIEVGKICYPSISEIETYNGVLIFNPVVDLIELAPPVKTKDKDGIVAGLNSALKDDDAVEVLYGKTKNKYREIAGYQYGFLWRRGKASIVVGYNPKGSQSGFLKISLQPSLLTFKDMQAFEKYWNMLFTAYGYLKLENVYQMPCFPIMHLSATWKKRGFWCQVPTRKN